MLGSGENKIRLACGDYGYEALLLHGYADY